VYRAISTGVCAALLLAFVMASTPPACAADIPAEAEHQGWVDTASMGLDLQAAATLQRIHGADRRLLALRAYLRAGSALSTRWSLSEQQLAQYPSAPEGEAAAADIGAVVAGHSRLRTAGQSATAKPRGTARALGRCRMDPKAAHSSRDIWQILCRATAIPVRALARRLYAAVS
jgi:hypothetical protein